jgi:hypothetical protein
VWCLCHNSPHCANYVKRIEQIEIAAGRAL